MKKNLIYLALSLSHFLFPSADSGKRKLPEQEAAASTNLQDSSSPKRLKTDASSGQTTSQVVSPNGKYTAQSNRLSNINMHGLEFLSYILVRDTRLLICEYAREWLLHRTYRMENFNYTPVIPNFGHGGNNEFPIISPDRQSVRVINAETFQVTNLFTAPPLVVQDKWQNNIETNLINSLTAATISPDGKLLAAISGQAYTYIWNLETKSLIFQSRHNSDQIKQYLESRASLDDPCYSDSDILFSPNNRFAVSRVFWDLYDINVSDTVLRRSIQCNSNDDSREIAFANNDQLWIKDDRILDSDTLQPFDQLLIDKKDTAKTFSPKGTYLALCCDQYSINEIQTQVIILSNQNQKNKWDKKVVLRGPQRYVSILKFSPDGSMLIALNPYELFIYRFGIDEKITTQAITLSQIDRESSCRWRHEPRVEFSQDSKIIFVARPKGTCADNFDSDDDDYDDSNIRNHTATFEIYAANDGHLLQTIECPDFTPRERGDRSPSVPHAILAAGSIIAIGLKTNSIQFYKDRSVILREIFDACDYKLMQEARRN